MTKGFAQQHKVCLAEAVDINTSLTCRKPDLALGLLS